MVVITGVGGTDTRSKTHKHASHTKGGKIDSAARQWLSSTAAARLLVGKPIPLFTVDKHGEKKGAKFYGSYLLRLAPQH